VTITIDVNGPYTVGPKQTLTYTASAADNVTSQGVTYRSLYVLETSGDLVIQGQVLLQDSGDNVDLSGAYTTSQIGPPVLDVASGGSLTVNETSALSVAYAFLDQNYPAGFINDGTVVVNSAGSGTGVSLDGGSFANRGSITVTSSATGAAQGLYDQYPLTATNWTSITVRGGSAEGVVLIDYGTGTFNNGGPISATSPDARDPNLSNPQAWGIHVASGQTGYDPGPVWINNTGTITATDANGPGVAIGAERFSGALLELYLDNFPNAVINGDVVLYNGSGSHLLNEGAINGAVTLGITGNDVYDGWEGTLSSGITLGGGLDTVYLGNDGETVNPGTGSAIVYGGRGNDTITGGPGNDSLIGGGGNDTVTGGLGADTFVVSTAPGSVTVTDFSYAQGDKIDLAAFTTLHSLADVQALAVQSGANTVINLGGGSTLTLDNVSAAGLTGSDFLLGSRGQDFNADGLGDILWRNDNGDLSLWTAQPGANLSFAFQDLSVVPTDWSVAGTGDFNGDGKADILWNNLNGDIDLWTTQSGSSATFAYWNLGGGSSEHIAGVGDFNGDGKADILMWFDGGGERFIVAEVSASSGPQPSAGPGLAFDNVGALPPGGTIDGVGDFNGDGRSDILVQDGTGLVQIWLSQALSNNSYSFPVIYWTLGRFPTWHVLGAGDINGDGKADILWLNDNGELDVWLSSSSTFGFTPIGVTTLPSSWHFQDIVDLNGDGRGDIVWRNDSGDVSVWLSQPSSGVAFTFQDLGVVPVSWHIQSQWLS
jgi:hypothetical protein